MATLVLTVIGDDRSGLVDALSGVIADHGGNWDKSRMARLAGKFAGIVMVAVPDAAADALIADLEPLEAQGLLDITVERAVPGDRKTTRRCTAWRSSVSITPGSSTRCPTLSPAPGEHRGTQYRGAERTDGRRHGLRGPRLVAGARRRLACRSSQRAWAVSVTSSRLTSILPGRRTRSPSAPGHARRCGPISPHPRRDRERGRSFGRSRKSGRSRLYVAVVMNRPTLSP